VGKRQILPMKIAGKIRANAPHNHNHIHSHNQKHNHHHQRRKRICENWGLRLVL
jgi:hypothetical protein